MNKIFSCNCYDFYCRLWLQTINILPHKVLNLPEMKHWNTQCTNKSSLWRNSEAFRNGVGKQDAASVQVEPCCRMNNICPHILFFSSLFWFKSYGCMFQFRQLLEVIPRKKEGVAVLDFIIIFWYMQINYAQVNMRRFNSSGWLTQPEKWSDLTYLCFFFVFLETFGVERLWQKQDIWGLAHFLQNEI